jgi:hypothetical protein
MCPFVANIHPPTIHTVVLLLISPTGMIGEAASSGKKDFNFGSEGASDYPPPIRSNWVERFAHSRWEVWWHRVLVTIVIVIACEVFLQPKRQAQRSSAAEQRPPKRNGNQHPHQKSPSKANEIGVGKIHKVKIREHASLVTTDVVDTDTEAESTGPKERTSLGNDDLSAAMTVHKTAAEPNLKNTHITDCHNNFLRSHLLMVPEGQRVVEPRSGDNHLSVPSVWSAHGASLNPQTRGTATMTVPKSPPRILAKSSRHPGMSGFAHWYEAETSLYRIYTLTRKDGQLVVPPYNPHSNRGNLKLFLHVTNSTRHLINVYWVDYKGAHILKGIIKPDCVWTQSTWIDHRKCYTNDVNRIVSSGTRS